VQLRGWKSSLPRHSGGSAADKVRPQCVANAPIHGWTALGIGVLALGALAVTASKAYAYELLEVWPSFTISEQFRDNLPLATNSTSTAQPPLFPIPVLPNPFPVNSKPPRAPAPSSQTSPDAISIATLGLTAALAGENRTLRLDYRTDAQLYAKNSEFNQFFQDQYISLRDQERISEASVLSLSDTFVKAQQVFGEGLIGQPGTGALLTGRTQLLSQGLLQSSYIANSFDANLSHRLSERWGSTFDVHQTYFSTSSGQTSESFQQGATASASYAFNQVLSLGPLLDFEDFRFSNQPRSDSLQPTASLTWRPKWRPKGSWLINASTGPIFLNSFTGTTMDFGYGLSVSYLGDRWRMSLSSSRSPTLSAGLSGAEISEFFGASAIYQVNRSTSAYANTNYNQVSGQTVITASAGIARRITKNISIFGQYQWFNTNESGQSQNTGTSQNTENALTFGLRFTPEPLKYRFRSGHLM
jgi:hypothetical protein